MSADEVSRCNYRDQFYAIAFRVAHWQPRRFEDSVDGLPATGFDKAYTLVLTFATHYRGQHQTQQIAAIGLPF